MKSFFKKIALVLALAMVVTMMPAKTAAAADGPQMYSTLRLYLGGDATEKYSDAAYAKVWNKDGYTVAFTSENPEVAAVGSKKGLVTAVGVGSTIITATFTNENGYTVTRTCKVTVKKNAVEAGISENSAAKLAEGLAVGDTFQTKAYRTDADGVTTWKGKDVITDGARFASSNTDVFTVTKTGGYVKAVGAGEATLKVWAVQTEGAAKDENGAIIEYLATTSVKEYPVKVISTDITAEQSAYNAFEVTFPTEEEAKIAVEKTAPALTNPDAAVTENKEIIKVYKVIKNANNEKVGEVVAFIGNVNVNGTVATVTMFDELEQETEYVIRYQDKETAVTTIKNVAVSMDIVVASHEKLGEDSSKTEVGYKLFAVGPNGQLVDITGCKDYTGWESSVELEDTNTTQYHAEYTFDKASRTIWFYTADVAFTVTLKATFEDWFNITDSKPNRITTAKGITPGDNSVRIGKILDYGVNESWIFGSLREDWAYSNKAFAADDDHYYLFVKASLYDAGKETVIYSEGTANDKFTFVSSNDDKLIVDKDTGALFPPKTPVNGEVGVHVYYDDQYIGTCNITVYAKRTFTNFTASVSDNKLDYNSAVAGTDEDVADTVVITLKPVDQLQSLYLNNMTFDAEVYGSDTVKSYLNVSDIVAYDKDGNPYFTVTANDNLPTTVTNFRIVCTATYTDEYGKETVKKYSVALAAKNTKDAAEKSYKVEAADSLDMIIDTEKNTVASKQVVLSAYSYDKDGFKVKHLSLTSASAAPTSAYDNTLVVQLGSEYVKEENLAVSGSDVVLIAVTGSAEDASVIEKLNEGSYVAYLYVGDGSRPVYKASKLISITDSQPKVTWTWVKSSTSETTVEEAIKDCIIFKYGANNVYGPNNIVNSDIYVNEGDYTVKGNKLTIDKVRYDLQIGSYIYKMEIAVKRTITMNITE